MATLTSGEYSLTESKNVVHEDKTMFFVKLTDSAQRALNNYFRYMSNCDVPLIEFSQDKGRILIPNGPAGDTETDKYMAQFKFNVTSMVAMQGRQGRFECVQHSPGTKRLIKYGQLTQRLTIHANEDVYERTKNRMAAIESQQRKNSTKQLDFNPTTISRKVRINTPKSSPTITKSEDPKPVPLPEISNMIRTKSRPVTSLPPQKINPAACIIRKPLKERLIHLLAVRPYKKLELFAALKKDGVRDCDRPHLMDTLISISTLRENVYHLAKHAWNDVQEDWLFYSELEKQQVKKNKLRNLTSPSSSDSGISVSSNQSPNNNGPVAEDSPNSYKRPGYINGVDGFQTKRQRISRVGPKEPPQLVKTNVDENAHPSQSRLDECSRAVVAEKPTSISRNFGRNVAETRSNFECEYPLRRSLPTVIVSSPEVSSTSNGHDVKATRERPTSPDYEGNQHFQYSQPPPPPPDPRPLSLDRKYPNEKPKYMKEYVTITDMEQRRKYKADFNEIFKEYQRVHEEVDSISNTFAQLGESLRQHKKGTPKYTKIENEIFKKYYALKRSEKFQAAKRRFEYLHEKLSHIKNLVHEYDQKMLK